MMLITIGINNHCLCMNIDRKLTLKAPIMTAADGNFCNIFLNFQNKEGMVIHENRLPADDSQEMSCLICYF